MINVRVNSLEHLKGILEDAHGDFKDFHIQLNGGLRSSKQISLIKDCIDLRFKAGKTDKFQVFSSIDGSIMLMTENELKAQTNIVYAIKHRALFHTRRE